MSARFLVVHDNPQLGGQIRHALEETLDVGEVLEVRDGPRAFEVMLERRPDVVLCDLDAPGFDGVRFLNLRASRSELGAVPVIMLTPESALERKLELLERGATDYVTKPFTARELVARVRVHYRVKALQDELREANVRLEALAVTDELTGLYNRRHLNTILASEFRRQLRYRNPLSLMLLDVDRFKLINDTFGHAKGDEVLQRVSKFVASSVRATDWVARYGGEELAIVVPHTSGLQAAQLGERLRKGVAELKHPMGGALHQCTASFGISACDETVNGPADMMKRADEALYVAKRAGRNQVQIFSGQR